MRLQNREKGMWQLLGEMYNCETISQNWFSCTESMDGLDELSQAAILEVPHPEPGLHWAGREIYPGPESAAPGTECHCVDLTTVQVKTWISQAWELGVREAVLAGMIFGVLLEDAVIALEARMLKPFP